MSLQRQLRRGLRVLLRRAAADRELSEELRHYYEEEIAALVARGRTRAQATREVRLRLGDPGHVVEDVRAHGWERVLDGLMTDLRHAVRRLQYSPGFTLVSVLTLALGMGASTAIFSAIKPILLEALPYEGAHRIVMVADRMQDGSALDVTFGTYREIVQRSRSFAALATLKIWQPTLTGGTEPERLEGQRIGAEYFQVLGVQPALGRDFSEEEDRASGPHVVMLSHGLWQRRFVSDPDVIGRTITLNDDPFTVIGVLPPAFENVLSPAAEVWAPLQYDAALPADGREWGHHLRMVGRLNESVDLATARRELDRIAQTPLPQFVRMPWAAMSGGMIVSSLQDDLTRGVRPALLAVIGAVLLLLVIACVNVTNLLLVRGAQRSGELALRAALGAGRDRLIAQLVVETMLLALLGAMLGLGVARLGVRALVALSPPELPRVSAMGIDAGVFAFAFGSATLIGLAVGIFVALHVSRRQPGVLVQRQSARVAGGDQRTRRVLVVAQVGLAVVLLVSAGLLLRSLQRLFGVHPGFDAEQVLTMQVQTSSRRFEDDDQTRRFFAQALDAVRAVPGVSSAAFTSQLPLTGDFQKYGVHFEAEPVLDPQEDGSVFRYAVTPEYFATMRIPLRRGRLLDERDRTDTPPVVVINESFARRFAGADPIGQHIRVGSTDQPWATIVGVVADVHQVSLGLTQENAVYLPTTQGYFADRTLWLVVRTQGEPATLATPIRNSIWSVDRDQPISRVATMDELVRRSAAERRFTLVIFNAFALAALLLAAIGLYGVLAAIVTARLREMGVRAALGAARGDIVALIVGHGMRLTAVGLVLGFTGALAAARVLRSLLFGISELDPVTYAGVLLLMLAVGGAACWLPAVRASRVAPSRALRVD